VEIIIEADNLFSQNKYTDSLLVYQDVLTYESLSNDEREYCLGQVLKICKLLGYEEDFYSNSIQLTQFKIDNKRFKDALNLLNGLSTKYKKIDLSTFNSLGFVAAIHSGQLDQARTFSSDFLDYQISKKNLPAVRKHLVERLQAGLKTSDIHEFKMNIFEGNIQWFEQFEDEIVEEYKLDKYKILKIMSSLYHYVENEKFWKKSSTWKFFSIIRNINLLRSGDKTQKTRKEIAHAIYDLLLIDPSKSNIYELVLDLAIINKRSNLATVAVEVLTELNKPVAQSVNEIIKELGPDPADELDTDLDMGTDLFRNVGQLDDKVSILVSKIEFLKSSGNLEKVNELIEELRALDSNHALVKDVIEKEQREVGSRILSEKEQGIDNIEENLLLEISQYLPENSDVEKNDLEANERAYKKVISLMPLEELMRNAIDLVSVFNTMGMPKVSLLILEYLSNTENDDLSIKESLNIKYLTIESYIEAGRLYKALNIVEEVCEKYPLMESEKKCFYYIRAELLRSLGNIRESLRYYVTVSKIDSSYRMIKQRLREFE